MIEGPLAIIIRLDTILQKMKLSHSPSCRLAEGVNHYFCECGLTELEQLKIEVREMVEFMEKKL